MDAYRNMSCYERCVNVSDVKSSPVNGNCQYLCTDVVQCVLFCPDAENNSTRPEMEPDDLLVFLESPSTLEGLLFLVGNVISMICLLVTVVVHVFLRKNLWTLQGRSLVSLTVALFMAKLAFQVNPCFSSNKYLCSLMSILQHYFCMSAFLWLSVLIYNIWKYTSLTEIPPKKVKAQMLVYIAYAWGTPSMAVITCVVVEFLLRFGSSYGSSRYCGILGDELLLYSLALPLAVITLINTGLFGMILIKRAKKISSAPASERMTLAKRREMLCGITDIEVKGHSLKSYVKLSALMTIGWMTGFAASNKKQFCTMWFCDWWIFFVILNCLQGVFVMMNFCLNREVFELLQEKCYVRMRRIKKSLRGARRRPRMLRSRRYKEMADSGTDVGTPTMPRQHSIRTISGSVGDTSIV